ncbi:hypothetical protein [Ornithinimicrobium kibberense]
MSLLSTLGLKALLVLPSETARRRSGRRGPGRPSGNASPRRMSSARVAP